MDSLRRGERAFERGNAALEVGVGAAAPLGDGQQGEAREALDVVEPFHGLDHPASHEA